MQPLTKRQAEILHFIIAHQKRESRAPSFREISEACGGIVVATIYEHLKSLEVKGYIVRQYNQPRAIVVLHDPDHPDVCPACERPFESIT